MGVPGTLREATEVLCRSDRVKAIDVGRLLEVGNVDVPDRYFIQRLYLGVEPEEQTSREMKDRYGVFAYAVNMAQRGPGKDVSYRAEVDGAVSEFHASRVYVVNSGMMGSGLRITHRYAVDDGLLDAFAIDGRTRDTMIAVLVAVPRPAHPERVPVPPPMPDPPDRDHAGPARLGRRRVHRADADQHRGRSTGAVGCRSLPPAPPRAVPSRVRPPLSGDPILRDERLQGQAWFSQVTPTLWVGGAPTYGRDFGRWLGLGITAVMDLRAERDADQSFFDAHGITYRQYRAPDVTVPGPGGADRRRGMDR